MKYYNLKVSEEHLHLIANAIEDWSRFLAGQCEMCHATMMLDTHRQIYDIMTKDIEPLVGPGGGGSSYAWNGGDCQNEQQRKAIAMSYGIYRSILHAFAIENNTGDWNVYKTETLRCPEQGGLPEIAPLYRISTNPKYEEWRDIPTCEGIYQVSSLGRIRACERTTEGKEKHRLKSRILKAHKDIFGYWSIKLHKLGHKAMVHRLVAEAFIPNPYNLPEVNHKDENKSNNHVGNLEWCTKLYNVNYGTRLERAVSFAPVAQLEKDGTLIATYKSIADASRYTGVGECSIRNCIKGRSITGGGFKWEPYDEERHHFAERIDCPKHSDITPTLTCPEQGGLIEIEEIKEDK